MSQQVEHRVVEMRFDNSNFEKNVSDTMDSLQALDKSLNQMDRGKTFDAIDSAAKSVDMSSLESGVGVVQKQFSLLEEIAVGALRRVGEQIVNTAEQMVKSITIDPITQGFDEYELKMNSVQTIMNGTGASLEEVMDQLEELNTYADKTIYSFSDMTSSIGQFTNAGVELEPAVAAVKGVSNAAALAGANASKASHAMYNFGQALSTGYVGLLDWKSIEVADMATTGFKEHLLETAVACGTVEKTADGMYQVLTTNSKGSTMDDAINSSKGFRDSLNYQWMTTEVLTQALEHYATDIRELTEAEKEEYEVKLRSLGYTEQQIKDIEELGMAASDSAKEVKTFTQLIDTMQEAVGSGWAQTWEIIFGDFNEAKALFTDLSNYFDEIIGNSADVRNEVLSIWDELGGRQLVFGFDEENGDFGILWNIIHSIDTVLSQVKFAFGDIFMPDTAEEFGQTLYNVTKAIKDFTAKLVLSDEAAANLRDTFGGVFAIFDILFTAVKAVAKGFKELISIFPNVGDGVLGVTGSIGRFIKAIDDAIKGSGSFEKIINAIVSVLKVLLKPLASVSEIFVKLTTNIRPLPDLLRDSLGDERYERCIEALATVSTKLVGVWENLRGELGNLGNKFKDSFGSMVANMYGAETASEGLEIVRSRLNHIGDTLKDALVSGLESLSEFDFSSLTAMFGSMLDAIIKGLTTIGRLVIRGWGVIKSIAGMAMDAFRDLGEAIKVNLGDAAHSAGEALSNSPIVRFFQTIYNWINKVAQAIYNSAPVQAIITRVAWIAEHILRPIMWVIIDTLKEMYHSVSAVQFIVVLFAFSLVKSLLSIADAIGGFGEMLEGVGSIFKRTSQTIKTFNKAIKTRMRIAMMREFTACVAILAGCMFLLSRLTTNELKRAGIALGAIAAAVVAIEAIFVILSKTVVNKATSKRIKILGDVMLEIGATFALMALSLKMVSTVEMEGIFVKLGALALLMAEFAVTALGIAAISKLLGGVVINTAAMLGVAGAMLMCVLALKLLGTVNPEEIGSKAMAMMGIMYTFANVVKVAHGIKFTEGMGLMVMALDMIILVGVLKKLAQIEVDDILDVIPQFLMLLSMLGTMALATRLAGEHAISAAVSIVLLTVAAGLLTKVIKAYAAIPTDDLKKGEIAVGAMMVVFGLVSSLTHFASKNAARAGIGILAMAVAMNLLVRCIETLGKMDKNVIKRGEAAVGGAMAIFSVCLAIASMGRKKGLTSSILAMMVAVGIITAAVGILTLLEWERVLASAGALSMVLLSVGVATHLIDGVAWDDVTKTALAMGIMLAETVGALLILNYFVGDNDILNGALGLAVVLGVLGAVFAELAALSKWHVDPKEVLKLEGAFAALEGIVTAMVAAMGALNAISINGGPGIIDEGIAMMTKLGSKEFAIAMGTLLGLFAGESAIAMIGHKVDPTGMSTSFGSLASIELAFGLLEAIVTAMIGLMGSLNAISLDGEVGIIDEGIAMIQKLGSPEFAKAMALLFGLFVGESAIAVVLSLAGPAGSAIGVGTIVAVEAAFASMILIIEAVLAGTGALAELVQTKLLEDGQDFFEIFDKGVLMIEKTGEAIGRFFGAIVGGAVSGAFSALLADVDNQMEMLNRAADGLSTFSEKIQPFMDTCSQFGEYGLEGVRNLAGAVTEMAKADFISSVSKLFTGGDDDAKMESFFNQVSKLGTALGKFSDATKDLNLDNVDKGVTAAEKLVTLQGSIDPAGGFYGWLTGHQSLEQFGRNLGAFGQALGDFATNATGVDEDTYETAKNCAQKLVDLQNTIDPAGGVWGWLAGNQTLDQFGKNLKQFGTSLKDFQTETDELKISTFAVAAACAQKLVDIQNSIDPNGGVFGFFRGDQNLTEFGTQLATSTETFTYGTETITKTTKGFGQMLKEFQHDILGLNPAAFDTAVAVTRKLVELQDTLDPSGGIKAWIFGDEDLGGFGENISGLGTGLKDFYTETKDINTQTLEVVLPTIEKIIALKLTEKSGGIFDKSIISILATNLGDFGAAFKKFGDTANETDWESVENAITELNKVHDTMDELANIGESAGTNFKANAEAFAQAGGDAFFAKVDSYIKEIKEVGTRWVDALYRGINEMLPTIETIGERTGATYEDAINKKTTSRVEVGVTAVSEVAQGIEDNQEAIENAAETSSNTFVGWILSKASDRYQAGVESVNDVADGANDVIDEKIGENGSAGELVNKFTTVIDNSKESILNTGKGMVDDLTEGIHYQSPIMITETRTIGSQSIESFRSLDGESYDAGKYLADKATAGVATGEKEMKTTGENLGLGVAEGLGKSEGRVTGAAKSLIQKAANMMKKTADEHSPSKVTEEIGGYMGEGLAIGLDGSVDDVTDSASAMVDAALAELGSRETIRDFQNTGEDAAEAALRAAQKEFDQYNFSDRSLVRDMEYELDTDFYNLGIESMDELELASQREMEALLPDYETMGVEAADATIDGIRSRENAVSDTGEELRNDFETTMTDRWSLMEAGEKMAQYIAEGIKNGKYYVTDAANELRDTLVGGLSDVASEAAEGADYDALASGFSDAVDEAVRNHETQTVTIRPGANTPSWLMSMFTEEDIAGPKITYEIGAEVGDLSGLPEPIRAAIQNGTLEITYGTNIITDALIPNTQALNQTLEEYTQELQSLRTIGEFDTHLGPNGETAEDIAALRSITQEAIPPAAQALTDAASEALMQAVRTPFVTANAMNGILMNAAMAGEAVDEGLIQGMNSSIGAVALASATTAGAIINAMNQELDIHSPSHKAEEVGEMVVWGLSIGLLSGLAGLTDATSEITGETLQLMDDIVNSEDWTFEPTIRPIVDVSGLSSLQAVNDVLAVMPSRDLVNKVSYEETVTVGQNEAMTRAVEQLSGRISTIDEAISRLQDTINFGLVGSVTQGVKEGLSGTGVYMDGRQVGRMTSSYIENMKRRGGY